MSRFNKVLAAWFQRLSHEHKSMSAFNTKDIDEVPPNTGNETIFRYVAKYSQFTILITISPKAVSYLLEALRQPVQSYPAIMW